jgi:predicted lipoprotein with Yx(FWY)xxD motif
VPVRRTISALVLTMIVFAGCSASGATTAPTTAPATAPASAAPASAAAGSASASSVTIGTATSPSLGSFLTGPNGMTLYTHTGDSATASTCTGPCATAWPPLTLAAGGQATAGSGVSGTLATLMRADGTTQVTYAGLPLYYWQGDAKAGDTTGEGSNGFLVATVGGPAPVPSDSGKPGY